MPLPKLNRLLNNNKLNKTIASDCWLMLGIPSIRESSKDTRISQMTKK